MPAAKRDLPSTLLRSAERVQRVYEEALKSAEKQYDSEERAQRTAWAAVKHVAEKQGDHWEQKDEPGPSDPQAAQSGEAARSKPRKTAGGVDASKTKAQLMDDAKAAGIEGRSKMSKDELVDALKKANDRETRRSRSRAKKA
jgi:cation transport regulator ChaB